MIKAIVGANWGDEGKGKLTDVFASESDIVVRFQGGNNAGHTIINDQGKFALKMLPSGVFYKHTINVIGNGVALNIPAFIQELEELKSRGVHPQVIVSDRAQIVMSYHKNFDVYEEARMGKDQFGSTKSGIAPFYSDKYAKIGFQVCELYNEDWLRNKINRILDIKNTLLVNLYHQEPLSADAIFEELMTYRDLIDPYVRDVFTFLNEAHDMGKNILFEGQLGALRDPDFGIYPYSTSSSTLAYFATIGAGLPHPIDEVWAVTKAYSSCVGAGAFVSEIFGDEAEALRKRGGDAGEYGVNTKRPRRVGYFDAVATRFGCKTQGATHVALTNIDVLSYLDEIKVVTAYEYQGQQSMRFGNITELEQTQPVIEIFPGWKEDITHINCYDDLPENCKNYINKLEALIDTSIALVSNGPNRNQIMKRTPLR
ncbi:adenylosuccinate synthase [Erysipelothrix rhusiopathiae]|nr:adenylosuccinate synthase [Erysipelothrix rhusiopathiae]MDE8258981.1 adenylosuccinate synthase [Erysipelothrix rhusiopathiae]MDE8260595.1 adenylosuccinate synthase [Erysipelothrix rhusiopathiae]MDE9425100.1 adenylosuccinate synthase [Erysipelothrix rhusiopathiae]MDE9426121.1 adenylosuccinate synthase [Erysipelothrix rhusiopathiae]